MQTHPNAAQLKELQDDIYREKVLRARGMTLDERFSATLEQIDFAFEMMRDGIRMQFPGSSDSKVEAILNDRMDRLRRLDDRHLFVPTVPIRP